MKPTMKVVASSIEILHRYFEKEDGTEDFLQKLTVFIFTNHIKTNKRYNFFTVMIYQ